jgi:hypothetical protein
MSIDTWLRGRQPTWRSAASVGLAMLVLGSAAASSSAVRVGVENRALLNETTQYAAEAARSMSGDDTCGVMTTPTPQVTYYSECSADVFRPGLDAEQAVDGLVGEDKYMIVIEQGRRQPNEAELAELIDLTDGDPVLIEGVRAAAVYTFVD